MFEESFNLEKYISFFQRPLSQRKDDDYEYYLEYMKNLREISSGETEDEHIFNFTDDESEKSNSNLERQTDISDNIIDLDLSESDEELDEEDNDGDDEDDDVPYNNTFVNHDNILEQLSLIKAIDFHKNLANVQKKSYNRMVKHPKYYRNAILLDFDYKQKIVFGKYFFYLIKKAFVYFQNREMMIKKTL